MTHEDQFCTGYVILEDTAFGVDNALILTLVENENKDTRRVTRWACLLCTTVARGTGALLGSSCVGSV